MSLPWWYYVLGTPLGVLGLVRWSLWLVRRVPAVLYTPIAGHRPERPAIKYLIAQRDMEMWLAPITGTRVLVPFRFSVPTPFGLGTLQATYFVANEMPTQALRQSPATAKTQ
jgi:hypothetical protein